jgi:hypothetical protein
MFGLKVICWALLFIFKLRFPPGVSIATKYSHQLSLLQDIGRGPKLFRCVAPMCMGSTLFVVFLKGIYCRRITTKKNPKQKTG